MILTFITVLQLLLIFEVYQFNFLLSLNCPDVGLFCSTVGVPSVPSDVGLLNLVIFINNFYFSDTRLNSSMTFTKSLKLMYGTKLRF